MVSSCHKTQGVWSWPTFWSGMNQVLCNIVTARLLSVKWLDLHGTHVSWDCDILYFIFVSYIVLIIAIYQKYTWLISVFQLSTMHFIYGSLNNKQPILCWLKSSFCDKHHCTLNYWRAILEPKGSWVTVELDQMCISMT